MEKRSGSWGRTTCSVVTKYFNGDEYTHSYPGPSWGSCGDWPSPTTGTKGTWSPDTSTITRAGQTVQSLPSLGTNADTLTMSGFSSGGFKTAYIFNQWPKKFRGVGILSGSMGDLFATGKATRLAGSRDWMSWRKDEVAKGVFPPKSDFTGKPVYLQSGDADTIVFPTETAQTAQFFEDLGAKVKYNKNQYAHIVPSIANTADPCGGEDSSSAQQCDGIDTVGDMWRWIMPTAPKAMENNYSKKGSYYFVDTRPFTVHSAIVPDYEKIADAASLYVPNACKNSRGCDLHVFMHGCTQAENEDFFKKSGILQYAASNNVVVLMPRITGDSFTSGNSAWSACWRISDVRPINTDIQSQAIYEMIKHLQK